MGKKLSAGKFLWGASAAIGLIFFGAFLAFPPPKPELMAFALDFLLLPAVFSNLYYAQGRGSGRVAAAWRILSAPLALLACWVAVAAAVREDFPRPFVWELLVLFAFMEVALQGKTILYYLRRLPGGLKELRRKFRERREWKKAMRRPK